jgi:heme-degrading monooxygenase HmoA
MLANTPPPPYYAVIFTSLRTEGDNGYPETAGRMAELVRQQPGFLGMESARDGVGITVCYWDSEASIRAWQRNTEHLAAQQRGIAEWYSAFRVRIAKVERDGAHEK